MTYTEHEVHRIMHGRFYVFESFPFMGGGTKCNVRCAWAVGCEDAHGLSDPLVDSGPNDLKDRRLCSDNTRASPVIGRPLS